MWEFGQLTSRVERVLAQTGMPRNFVAASRLGAVRQLHTLMPEDAEVDWATLEKVASNADAYVEREEDGVREGEEMDEEREEREQKEKRPANTQEKMERHVLVTEEIEDYIGFLNEKRNDSNAWPRAPKTPTVALGN